ncbi:aminotransferase class I/II-fold pyridoxal phosphate-dependent enzyme [Rhodonellum sp.]|uniref:aminotransferase class I/II-fold pyridoxal phosphate-dependent enzyme n=1 Tax=Rhodonellum sp. TaxID=2231180 RepID=UPI00272444B4|nr:aminotransferase class I/II-fold pyridoxal phosphate-dependent enzyme [Rhodonellum sp.]MDO9554386.1 aminotransferase class I/II-fold pyridoxal phosphate-dependent enzyme [Rhodonellum sp.]
MHPFLLTSKINRTILHEGRDYLFFSGTAYLGMGSSEAFEELVISGIKKYGLNHGLSRINNVRLAVYGQFETYFAEKAGADRALVWSSGYLAGNAAVNHLRKGMDKVFVAPDTHPAVLPEDWALDPKPTFAEWVSMVGAFCEKNPAQKILILGNALDPLEPSLHDYNWIQTLPLKHEYTLLVDDSHAFGVAGEGIFGTYRQLKHLSVNLVVSGSLGKGIGLPAGIILGNLETIGLIENHQTFRSSSPPPPAYLDAFLQGQHLYVERKEKLFNNLEYFSALTKNTKGLTFIPRYPVYSFTDPNWVNHLQEHGIIVSSFPYPSAHSRKVNRIVISAHHEESDLYTLSKVLGAIAEHS